MLSKLCVDVRRAVKDAGGPPRLPGPSTSPFSAQALSKGPGCTLLSATFLPFLLVISLFKMAPRIVRMCCLVCSPGQEGRGVPHWEHTCVWWASFRHEFSVSEVSWNKHTCWSFEEVGSGARRNLALYFPWGPWFSVRQLRVSSDFLGRNCLNYEDRLYL